MTKEQAKEIKRIMGILEECKQDLEKTETPIDTELNGMSDEQAENNPDLFNLIDEIISLRYALNEGINGVIGRLDDVSGGLT